MGPGQDGGLVVDANVAREPEPVSDAALGTDAGDPGDAGSCSTLTVARRDVKAEADPSQPPPATGGTIADGTYRMRKFIYYRRSSPPPITTGGTLRFTGDIQEWASSADPMSGKYGITKTRQTKTPDGTHLKLTECICTKAGGGCALGVGTEQPYSVVSGDLWLYERDTNEGGGGDLHISVYVRE